MTDTARYKRVLLKLSGEALKGNDAPFDPERATYIAREIERVAGITQLGIVIGGGNIVRGRELVTKLKINRSFADHMGMISTIANALFLEGLLLELGVHVRTMSKLPCNDVCEPFHLKRAWRHLEKGRVVVFAGGTGNTGFSTDTAAVSIGLEVNANAVFKGTNVKGVCEADPKLDPDAELISRLTYDGFIERKFSKIFDRPAVIQAGDEKLPLRVFDIFKPGNLLRAVNGSSVGTFIGPSRTELIRESGSK